MRLRIVTCNNFSCLPNRWCMFCVYSTAQSAAPACPADSQSLISQTGMGNLILPISSNCTTSASFVRASFPDTDGSAVFSVCNQGSTFSFPLPKAPVCNVYAPQGPASAIVYQIFTPSSIDPTLPPPAPPTGPVSPETPAGISGGATAGIVVGVLAACSIAGFFSWKHFKRENSASSLSGSLNDQCAYVSVDSAYVPPPHQMASPHA